MFGKFSKDECGTALTEYLLLLSVLTGGMLVAVTLTVARLSAAYGGWSSFYSNVGYLATASGAGGGSATSGGGTSGNNGNGNGGGSTNAHGGNPNANPNAGGNGGGHGNH